MPDPHKWDSAKNEMVLIEIAKDAEFDYQLDVTLYIAFGQIEGLEGSPVISNLKTMGTNVHIVLNAMEAECRRLGYIK